MDDAALLHACARGDESALRTLHQRHARAAYAFALRLCGGRPQDADDAVAEAFIELWQGAARYAGRAAVRTWLLGIVRHKALDLLRRRGACAPDDPPQEPADAAMDDAAPDPFEQLAAQQQRDALLACFDQLPLAQREALYLALVEGMPLRDIARLQDVPEGTAGTRIHHAKRKLRECLSRGLKNSRAQRDTAA